MNNEPKPILPGPPIYYPGNAHGLLRFWWQGPPAPWELQPNTANHGAYASPFLGMRNIGVSPENNPPPMVYIRGQPAITLAASPVTKEQQAELERLRRTDYWEKLYHAMQRNVAQEHIVAFTADNGSREFSRWVNTCANYFEIIGILNPAVQGQLAVLAFRGTALDWWRAHRSHSPNYTLSFAQIAEWARTELLPESDPSVVILSWQRLKYQGNLDRFFKEVRALFVTNPMPIFTALTMVSDQFGPAFQSRLQAANAQAAPVGITMTHWEQILRDYVLTTEKPRPPPMIKPPERPPTHTPQPRARAAQLQELAETKPWEDLGIIEEEWVARICSIVVDPKDPRTPVVPTKYGEGPNPCFVCGCDGHTWIKCELRKREGRCGVCGSSSHLTMQCAYRYHPRPENVPTPAVTRTKAACAQVTTEPPPEKDSSTENTNPNPPIEVKTPDPAPEPEPKDAITAGAKACYVNRTPMGDQHAMKSLWDAMLDREIRARWVRVECQPQIVDPGTQELVELAEDPGQTGQIILTVNLDGVPARTLFDPGASHSFVDIDWAREHDLRLLPLPRPMSLSMFQEGVRGEITMMCRTTHTCVGPLDVSWVFCAIKGATTQAILGLDFIREHRLLYDPAQDGIYITPPGPRKRSLLSAKSGDPRLYGFHTSPRASRAARSGRERVGLLSL